MAGEEEKNKIKEFLKLGFYKFPNSNTIFIDPVRILNRNYSQFRVSPSSYYSRFFPNNQEQIEDEDEIRVSEKSKKRKRNHKKKKNHSYALNERELLADQRHREIRGFLVKAQEDLLGAKELLDVMPGLNCEPEGWECCVNLDSGGGSEEVSFVELGKVWQAPLYEITLHFIEANKQREDNGGSAAVRREDQRLFPIFNNLVMNETNNEVVADFFNRKYILPKESCFYMSDLEQIHNLVPGDSDCGFNFIMVDPPWENRSVYQKSAYPTLPNRYFLSIPIRQLTHKGGALVALWVTNREKLRSFVEKELFPAWGVKYAATLHWLKVKADGSLICNLDLFHHRPYECLVLGYGGTEDIEADLLSMQKSLRDDQVIITIPGDYSRKPPVGDLLMEHVPGPRPVRCIELFAREMMAGWTSWGNQPLHFQELRYFSRQSGQCTI